MDASFVVAVAFALFLILFHRRIGAALTKALDSRSKRIEHEMSEASRLRDEAQKKLSEYEKKYQAIEKEAEAMLNNARESAEAMQREATLALQKAIEAKLIATNEKIQRAEKLALQNIQQNIVQVALQAAQSVMAEHKHAEANARMISIATQDAKKIIH
jgi:F-type H+-transporting ATPase subunit b